MKVQDAIIWVCIPHQWEPDYDSLPSMFSTVRSLYVFHTFNFLKELSFFSVKCSCVFICSILQLDVQLQVISCDRCVTIFTLFFICEDIMWLEFRRYVVWTLSSKYERCWLLAIFMLWFCQKPYFPWLVCAPRPLHQSGLNSTLVSLCDSSWSRLRTTLIWKGRTLDDFTLLPKFLVETIKVG